MGANSMFEIDRSVFYSPRRVYATERDKIHVCRSRTVEYLLDCDAVAMALSSQGDCWVFGHLL